MDDLQPDRETTVGGRFDRRKFLGAALATFSAAGATAGVTFSDVSGLSTTVVDQGVIIRAVESYVFGNSLGTVSEDKTSFSVGADINQGDRYAFHLVVDNRSDQQQSQVFRFDHIPDGLSVDVFGDDPTNVEVARDGENRWLVEIEPDHSASVPADEQLIEVVVATVDNTATGFFQMEGRLEPFDFDGGDE